MSSPGTLQNPSDEWHGGLQFLQPHTISKTVVSTLDQLLLCLVILVSSAGTADAPCRTAYAPCSLWTKSCIIQPAACLRHVRCWGSWPLQVDHDLPWKGHDEALRCKEDVQWIGPPPGLSLPALHVFFYPGSPLFLHTLLPNSTLFLPFSVPHLTIHKVLFSYRLISLLAFTCVYVSFPLRVTNTCNREMLSASLFTLHYECKIILFSQQICKMLQIFSLKTVYFSNHWGKYK